MSPTACMWLTMARIDPQHLAWTLEKLVAGKIANQISLPEEETKLAKLALQQMLEVT
jgi:quinolinate synthase